ncbi:hypothetical protein HN630_00150 [archaeon]|jgi:hypothetical protein|nr:hypothetical protein [archaeon]
MTYQEICQAIFERLQILLEMEYPLFLLDEYISASRKKGSDLWDSELEELWLNMIADCFDDDSLRSLTKTRTEIYYTYEQFGLDVSKVA